LILSLLRVPQLAAVDCNHNGRDDAAEVEAGAAQDCNQNGILDACELAPTRRFPGTPEYRVEIGGVPDQGALSDLDRDGDLDLVLARLGPDPSLFVLLNDGAGVFAAASALPISAGAASVQVMAAGDLDGDGDGDVALLTYSASGDTPILFLENRGDASFLEPRVLVNLRPTDPKNPMGPVILPFPGRGLVAGDLDGDRDLDLVSGNLVFLNEGSAVFAAPIEITGRSPESSAVLAADLAGTRDLDLVLLDNVTVDAAVDYRAVLLVNDGAATFEEARVLPAGLGFPTVALDADGDRDLDLVRPDDVTLRALLLTNEDDAVFIPASEADSAALQRGFVLAAGDLDGDGTRDLVTAKTDRVQVFFGREEAGFEDLELRVPLASRSSPRVSGDIDRDGRVDLVAVHSTNQLAILLGEGDGVFREGERLETGANPQSIVLARLNSDALLDIATANFNSSDITVLLNRGGGSFGLGLSYLVGDRPTALVAGDFDRDGGQDLAAAAGVRVHRFWSRGNGLFSRLEPVEVSTGIGSMVAVNLDRDADLDLAATTSASIALLFNRGDGEFDGPVFLAFSGATSLRAEDMDGDGDADLLVRRGATSAVLINHGDGTFDRSVPLEVLFGAWADFDGDGDLDVAATEVQSSVRIFVNQGGFLFAEAARLSVGPVERTSGLTLTVVDADGADGPDLVLGSTLVDDLFVLLNRSPPPAASDCDGNAVPDDCDIAAGVLRDEDGDGVPDACEAFRRADPDADGAITISDPISILLELFARGPASTCPKSADADDDGSVQITDAIVILRYLFQGGPEPRPPFAECGTDPRADDLSCGSYPLCGAANP
jgi:hypothetical protein